jgi:hypothetical protein
MVVGAVSYPGFLKTYQLEDGSSGRALAQQAQAPEFKHQYHQKKPINILNGS